MKTIAIIGCGKATSGKEGWAIGHAHARGYLNCGHEIELLGVDLSPENLKAFGETFGLPDEQLFASTEELYAARMPDVVSICTWPALHQPMVLDAMEKGVQGIACEKPLALDTHQVRKIEAQAAKTGTKIVVSHQGRCKAYADGFKQVIADGILGSNLQAIGQVGDDWDILSWATHWLDLANYLFDGPPARVLAGMHVGDTRRYKHAVEDASVIFADYGERGTGNFLTGPGTVTQFLLRGENGLARIGKSGIECATFDGVRTVPFPTVEREGFPAMLEQLLTWMDGGPEARCSLRQSAAATEMAFAAQESARTGSWVELPLERALFAPLEVAQHPVRSALWGKQVLLYADAHGAGAREGIAEAFGELTGVSVRVVEAESRGLRDDDLKDVDAVLIYHTQAEAEADTCRLLENWVDKGHPLLIIHAGLGAWPQWEAYQKWCGIAWVWGSSYHPYEAAELKVSEGDPLAFGWNAAWLPRDEVFAGLEDRAPVELGLVASISIGDLPAAWRVKEHPNVGVWMPGHRRDSWRVPAMREGAARTLIRLFRG